MEFTKYIYIDSLFNIVENLGAFKIDTRLFVKEKPFNTTVQEDLGIPHDFVSCAVTWLVRWILWPLVVVFAMRGRYYCLSGYSDFHHDAKCTLINGVSAGN